MKRERLDWLANNPRYTKLFGYAAGRRCRVMTVKDVAEEMDLTWRTVKDLDVQYMTEQLQQAGEPSPRVMGIDEISVGPRHSLSIVVSDLDCRQVIWVGGSDRSEENMAEFYKWLGPEKK